MENKNVTAVEWLAQKLDIAPDNPLFEQAKAMAKERIMKANDDGFYECMHSGFQSEPMTSEQYYEETYGK